MDGASSLTATISDGAIDESIEYVFEVRGLNAANSDHDMLGSTAAFRGLTLVGVPKGDLLTLTDGAVVVLSDYDTNVFSTSSRHLLPHAGPQCVIRTLRTAGSHAHAH